MANQYEVEKEKYVNHFNGDDQRNDSAQTELETTPLFSLEVSYLASRSTEENDDQEESVLSKDDFAIQGLPQYALLGPHIGDHPQIGKREPIMLNTATPNSTFICGSQGGGKSYTLACMLENYLLPDADYGTVANPVAGIAFHYDPEGSNSIAEIASLCSRGIKVRVLASCSHYKDRLEQYMELAGLFKDNMEIRQLEFRDEHLNVDRMKRLMAFNSTPEEGVPLYVSVINKILREMSATGDEFTFSTFEYRIKQAELVTNQRNMLNLRLDILRSFKEKSDPVQVTAGTKTNSSSGSESSKGDNVFKTEPGTLTIVDLTDPFVDPTTACVLFDVCFGLFKENAPRVGMAVVLDEAHRYMNTSAAAIQFTESLLTTIKMQRHAAARVIVATQEPTISPRLMDLCSITIVHRFNSPAWFASIKDHLAAASDADRQNMFESIVTLNAGQSLVFSPSSFVCLDHEGRKKLGTGVMKMKTRIRKGIDSGKSRMAGSNDDAEPKCDLAKDMGGLKIAKR